MRSSTPRSFTLSHERFVLELDFDQRIVEGTAEITIQPSNDKLSHVRINCRQCNVKQVHVDNVFAEYTHNDAICELSLDDDADITHHQAYKSKYLTAIREADEGELVIKLPEGSIRPLSNAEAENIVDTSTPNKADSPEVSTPTTITDKTNITNTPTVATATITTSETTSETKTITYKPITVRIQYTISNPREGLVFVEPDQDTAPYRYQHVYTVNQPLPGATRSWLPCIDRISDRCTWEMEFIVPQRMATTIPGEDINDTTTMHLEEEEDTVVVCSGEMVEQVVHPVDSAKKIVRYNLSTRISAPNIGFAIGPFEMIKYTPAQLQDELYMTVTELDEEQQKILTEAVEWVKNIYVFAPPGRLEDLNNTCSFLIHAMHFYCQKYGQYPFTDYKLVFVEDAWCETSTSASLAICSTHLLHSPDIIDQTYHTRWALGVALARQYFGVHISPKSWPDIWLIRGLANFMASLFIKQHLGNNEYRLRLKRDIDLCCSLDINRAPLYNQQLPFPLDPEDLNFIELKAPLVLYMLDKRMSKASSSHSLENAIHKINSTAMSGQVSHAISTHSFLRLCRKFSGFDTRTFADQWIYKSGCPKFTFSYNFNRKRMIVEFSMRQKNTNSQSNTTNASTTTRDHNKISGASINNDDGPTPPPTPATPLAHISSQTDSILDYATTPTFTGSLTATIHEADGTPYEHILNITSMNHTFEVQFNTKYKRIRRNTKRFIAKQQQAAAAAAELQQQLDVDYDMDEMMGAPTNTLGIIPNLGLGMPVFEDEDLKKEWRISEWGQDEEDKSEAASATFDWIRLDSEFEWLCTMEFEQPDFMWAAQLTKDRDVVAQYEAVSALKRMPSLQTSTSLLRALLDPKCFYKIRMESAYALSSCAITELNWVGLLQLNKMFQKRYCFPLPASYMGPDNMDKDDDKNLPITHVIPKPNDFAILTDYFLQKASVVAFSQIRDKHGRTPFAIRRFILDLLKYNDNTGNEFSDNYYVSTLISALGDALIPSTASHHYDEESHTQSPQDERLLEEAKAEIERFRTLDYVVPSYHNVVTISCLQTLTKFMLNGLMPVDVESFLYYTRYGNYIGVRCAAFDSLIILCGLTNNDLVRYYFNVIKTDPSVCVSHYVARSMLAWLGLAMKDKVEATSSGSGQNGTSGVVEEFAEEEGRGVVENEQNRLQMMAQQQQLQEGIESLRKRFENNSELQKNMWDMLTSTENLSELDHCTRKYLLQLCEYMYKPIDSGLKVTIKMPPLQVSTEDQQQGSQKQTNGIIVEEPQEVEKIAQKPATILRISVPKRPVPSPSEEAKEGEVEQVPIPSTPKKPSKKPIVRIKTQPTKIIPVSPPPSSTTSPEPTARPPSVATKTPFTPSSKSLPTGMPIDQAKDCRRILGKLQKNRAALLFVEPVNEALDGAPDYYKIIKEPMDLGTIKAKLDRNIYSSFDEFEKDIRLIFNNCYTYNRPGTYVYNEAQSLESIFDTELQKLRGIEEMQNMTIVEGPIDSGTQVATNNHHVSLIGAQTTESITAEETTATVFTPTMDNSLTPNTDDTLVEGKTDMQKCAVILSHIMENQHAFEFLRPVDPIKQGIPDYAQIIKNPMDLGTIKAKLTNNEYIDANQFDHDVRLMLSNCYAFNRPGTYVYNEGYQLEQEYKMYWNQWFGQHEQENEKLGDKRKAREDVLGTPPPTSKPRLESAESVHDQDISSSLHIMVKKQPNQNTNSIEQKDISTEAVKRHHKKKGKEMDSSNRRRCGRILEKLWVHASSEPFRHPIDPNDVPQYHEMIKRPMDLSTIRVNLESSDHYLNIHELERDVRQIFWNCYQFNNKFALVSQQAKTLEKYFNELWANKYGSSDRLKPGDYAYETAHKVIEKLRSHDASYIFNEPVDITVITDYLSTIKKPIDLRTISEKLESGQYDKLQQVDADIQLMFSNCYAYNNPITFVHQQGKKLERYYNNTAGHDMKHCIKVLEEGGDLNAMTLSLKVPPTSAKKSKSKKKKQS